MNRHYKLSAGTDFFYDVHATKYFAHVQSHCDHVLSSAPPAMALEVLFEFENSRRRIVAKKSEVRAAIEKELTRFGPPVNVRYSGECGSSNAYLLQRWSTTWHNFIDVEDENDIEDRDRLTVVPLRSAADSEAPTQV